MNKYGFSHDIPLSHSQSDHSEYPFEEPQETVTVGKQITNPRNTFDVRMTNSSAEMIDAVLTRKVTFETSTDEIEIDLRLVLQCCPAVANQIDMDELPETLTVEVKDNLRCTALKSFFEYCATKKTNYNCLLDIAKAAEYFENFKVFMEVANLIEIELEKPSNPFSLEMLHETFNRMAHTDDFHPDWFNLFYKSINSVASSLVFFLEHHYLKLSYLDETLIEELVEKFFSSAFSHNSAVVGRNDAYKVLELILKTKKLTSVFDLLMLEEETINGEESKQSLFGLESPVFTINLAKDLRFCYQEYSLSYMGQSLNLILHFNQESDVLKISIKLDPYVNLENAKAGCLSFFTCAFVKEENIPEQYSLHTQTKLQKHTLFDILTINGFRQLLGAESNRPEDLFSTARESLTLIVNLKFCFFHSAIINHVATNFVKFYKESQISQVNKRVMETIINCVSISAENENIFVIAMLNWGV